MTDESPEVDIPMPTRRRNPNFGNPEFSRQAALRKAEIERERRAETQIQNRKRSAAVLGEAAETAAENFNRDNLNHLSIEQIGDGLVRRFARIQLYGGEAFMPTSARECAELAKVWSDIAYKDAARRKANVVIDADESPALDAAKMLRAAKARINADKAS